jgi:hypothetical protein
MVAWLGACCDLTDKTARQVASEIRKAEACSL